VQVISHGALADIDRNGCTGSSRTIPSIAVLEGKGNGRDLFEGG